jgi:uncharacterized protein YjiS (DUF1127 family)
MERDMPNIIASHIALAEEICSRATIPAVSEIALKVAHVTLVWTERAKARRVLRGMDQTRLDDLGLTREQLYLETRKPFWRA